MTATLYDIKPRFQALLRPLVERAAQRGVRPNHLTVVAIGVSVIAGAAVGIGAAMTPILWLVPVLYLLRMALNAMDGLLAREHAMTSRSGAILNEVADVVSDVVAYLPFVFLLPDLWLLVVVVVVLGLVGEVTALAAADQSGRRNDGPLGKSDRTFGFGLVAVLAPSGADALVATVLAVMVLLGMATIRNRAVRGLGEEIS